MSDTDEEKVVVKGATELKGPDNFVQWKRSLRTKLASKGFIEYLTKEPNKVLEESTARVVVSSPPTAAEQSKLNEVKYKCEKHKVSAATIIFNSLSTVVQNRVPESKIRWEDANPKGLYDWLEKEFGASSSSRQAELWSMVWGVKVGEEEDPNTVLTGIRSTLSDLGSSVPAETTPTIRREDVGLCDAGGTPGIVQSPRFHTVRIFLSLVRARP
jgi:hypothetical protein